MPMPLWWGQINKRVFNPRELKKGDRPVLTHVGRSSRKVYQTPVDAHRVDGGYLFILVYGSKSDWVQNILAAGSATLRINGQETQLTKPRLLNKEEAWTRVDPETKEPPNFLRISEFLQMDEAS
ncbi:MAG: nitroreductase family deazaflavin-dependent oxidoreductase [Acidimicrobiia bacterium]|nr:nitroreductase family deazaflavin-dependent oxidoreductase [Acidimicrobiia bacterium]MDH5503560.1 nitroreductase family deazaflavin-dependent oxidoreductase [Acidimicrobiia bacterium]